MIKAVPEPKNDSASLISVIYDEVEAIHPLSIQQKYFCTKKCGIGVNN